MGGVLFFLNNNYIAGPVPLNPSGSASFSPGLSVGSFSLQAVYIGNSNAIAAIGNLTQTVYEGTTTTLSAPAVTYGQHGLVTVTVSDNDALGYPFGTPAGTLSLSVDNGQPLSGTLSNGGYTFDVGVLPAGTHTLSALYATQGYYAASSANGSLTVNRLAASVTPNTASKNYGAADPTLTSTLSGFLPADNVTATYSRTAGQTVLGGPYIISATLSPSPVLGNYTITYNTADFTINAASTTTTANAASATFSSTSQTITLGASVVPSGGLGTVNEGTVTFSVFNASTQIGSSVTSSAVASGSASAVFTLPGNTAGGAYQIHALYSPGPDFLGSSDISEILTVNPQGTTATLSASNIPNVFVAAGLSSPYGLVFDGGGNLYVDNYSNDTVYKVTPSGVVSPFLSVANGLDITDALAFASGNLYVASAGDNTVIKVTSSGVVSTFVAASAGLDFPDALAFDSSGNLYVANAHDNTVYKVTPGGVASTFVAASAGLDFPDALAFDSSGNLYVANENNNTVNKVTPGGVFSTFMSAGLHNPKALAFDSNGNLYVANAEFGTVIEVTPSGVVSTFISAGLDFPDALAFDSTGNLYVANYSDDNVITTFPVFGEPITFSVTIAPTIAGPSIPSGTVTFNNGSTTLGSATLDQTGNATLTYTGTALAAGSDPITVSYSGDGNDNRSTATIQEPVARAQTTTTPTAVTTAYTTSAQTLTLTGNVTSSNSSVPVNGGTFTFTVAGFGPVTSGTVSNGTASASFTLPAGTAPQTFTITTAYSGSGNFSASTNSTGALTVAKATPKITWLNPANITYGTALSGTQLDATHSVAGTFVYTPAAGTVLNAGIQTLTVAFTPTNPTEYISTSASVVIDVLTATLTVTTASKSKTYGAAFTAFTGGLTGVKNGDAITVGSYSSAGSAATATVAGGPYVISAALSDPNSKLSNYTVVTSYGSLTVNPAAMTITATSASKIYGQTFAGTAFTYSAQFNSDTVTSVTLTSTGAAATATVAGSPYNIVPSAAVGTGLSNYAITYANGHLTVTKAALTITANNQSKAYGQASNLGTTTFTASGLENSDTVTSVTETSTGSAATATVAGSPYNIVPSAAVSTGLNNYSVTYVDGLLTVTTAALTITANNQSKTYGLALNLGTTAVTASGLKNGDTVTSVTLTSSGTAATATVAGSPYNIVASAAVGARLANYTITYIVGQLTVNPAPLTITATSESKIYGQTFAGTAFTYSALFNSDTVTSVTLTSTGAAATATVAGSPYLILPSAAVGTGLSNYAITYANGHLTVTKAALTITANNQNKPYGQALNLGTSAFTTSGLENSDTVTSVTETSTGSAATAAAGTYNIVPTAAVGTGLSNYAITYVDGQLTVSKASPAFSSLSSPGIAHGPTIVGVPATISGEVAAGTTFATGSVVITITGNGVDFTKAATIGATNGVFSAVFTEIWAVGTYTVSYHYAGNSDFNAITPDGTSSLVVS